MTQLRLVTLAALLCSLPSADGGKVLVFPVDGSHWVNMKVLIQELHSRGHNITVIRSKTSWYITAESHYYQSVTLDISIGFDEKNMTQLATKMVQLRRDFHNSTAAFLKAGEEFLTVMHHTHKSVVDKMQEIFEDAEVMQFFQEAKYNVVLTDPCFGGGVLLAHRLGLPLVFNVRWTIIADGHYTVAPSPLSYVPIPGAEVSDKMTFWQKLKNILYALIVLNNQLIIQEPLYTTFVHRHFGSDVQYNDLVQAADIWLMRTDFTFEFPRPTMPNVVYMGGFQCKPSKPLPQHLEDFVQNSADHGVIIMSLGTLVGTLPEDIAEHVAAAFAQLPQKVIWRHTGKRPSTLGNNTLLLDWLPQNDLLGHPKTRVFVAHGGTNGLQEAIYHGVPIVGLPLMFDQDDNLFRMTARGVAKVLDIGTLNTDNFLEAVKAVLYEASYREKMQELSRLHRDQPMKPLDRAMFWIQFVMRHKGAAHLKTHSYKMSWIQYHSIDVIALLLVSVMMMSLLCILTVKCLCCKVFGGRKEKLD
ncbi:UDP-glucuronosyltransferase 2A2-like [Epinephelus fuscoguttatus]|uniref:UDP-glucuronosyltransferase 2A2-like n=1 Tax=Epinephelus fuscoguttatus TaxID=293821 RepID=UPI0020D0A591|nr:UDP-glucuronosyltransferase 2A2-like [Epinephelus fuscoguttatus]XP_049434501.1 UDP-glucuronosyltransferase 2A2-like [Epinephelus fuscoguttatus]